ncbi:unnamed protein product, partial [Meganyctiphanes norvegica]
MSSLRPPIIQEVDRLISYCISVNLICVLNSVEHTDIHFKKQVDLTCSNSVNKHYRWLRMVDIGGGEKWWLARAAPIENLCADQSYQVFQLFLLHQFRGAEASLADVMSSQRGEETFLFQLWNFYHSDRLYLLRSLRHVVANTTIPSHPYQVLFKEFVRDILDKDGKLGESLVEQVIEASKVTGPPASLSRSQYLPTTAPHTWIAHHLAKLRELLATLLVYYGSTGNMPPPETCLRLLRLAQGSGLCSAGDDSFRSSHSALVDAVDAMHSLLLMLIIDTDGDIADHPLCTDKFVQQISPVVFGLGARQAHLPPLLAWATLSLRAETAANSSNSVPNGKQQQYLKLAHRAVQGNVFQYLHSVLTDISSIKGDDLLLSLASSVGYSLMCSVAGYVELDTPAMLITINKLAQVCLGHQPPAELFWSEEGGGAGLLLPGAIEAFPQDSGPLLSLATALAKANTYSCGKVLELLTELPSVTWTLSEEAISKIQVRGSECVAISPIQLLPTIIISEHSGGVVVNSNPPTVLWHSPINGWQALLAIIKTLHTRLAEGGNVAESSVGVTVVATLELLAAILSTSPKHLGALQHFVQETVQLLQRVAGMNKAPAALVGGILAMLAQVAVQDPKSVWTQLEGCALLPFLSTPHTGAVKRNKSDPFLGYRPGGLRALVCGQEAASGKYPILRNYTKLLTAAVKGNVSSGGVSGGVVFLVREVMAGGVLRWCYASHEERALVLEECLSLLHHTLEAKKGCCDEVVRELVVEELLSGSGAGQTVLAVVVSGAMLEAVLSYPLHSPNSNYAHTLTHTAQLALSILHRLVGECPTEGGLSRLLSATPAAQVSTAPSSALLGSNGNVTSSSPPHLALTVALYVHHRLNPRLTNLALRTLTRFAQKLSEPLVACLGGEADGIRDALLRRLDLDAEDVHVKVALLRLLTASTPRQKGLTCAFLTPPDKLLDPLTSLIQTYAQTSSESAEELVCAAIELVDALWTEKHVTVSEYLKDNSDFWNTLAQPLTDGTPGEVNDKFVGHCINVLAHELFSSDTKPTAALKVAVMTVCDPKTKALSKWSSHIMSSSNSDAPGKLLLLPAWQKFLVVLVARAAKWLTDNQKVTILLFTLCRPIYLQRLDRIESDGWRMALIAMVFAEACRECANNLVSKSGCFERVGSLLCCVRAGVQQTPIHTQLLIFGAALSMVSCTDPDTKSQDYVSSVIPPVASLVQQHGVLAGASTCTSPAALGLATSLLHQCLIRCHASTSQQTLSTTPVVPAILHATQVYLTVGEEEVVGELLRLLSTLARLPNLASELSTHTLATTLALNLHTTKHVGLLAEVVWGVVSGLEREGVAGVEGAVGIAAIHLTALTSALLTPHKNYGLALAAAALVRSLAPHASQWIVSHPQSHSQLTQAITRSIHITTQLLLTPKVVQLELGGEVSKDGSTYIAISTETTSVLNHMLQVMCCHRGSQKVKKGILHE